VRILVDECLLRGLKRELSGLAVRTVPEMGWASKRNGELLALADEHFDVFVTVDRNLSFQNEVHRFALAVVVLQAAGNRLVDLRPLIPGLRTTLDVVVPGRVFPVRSTI
jgi:hypothetical protein